MPSLSRRLRPRSQQDSTPGALKARRRLTLSPPQEPSQTTSPRRRTRGRFIHPQHQSIFFRLPAEIRILIYQYLIGDRFTIPDTHELCGYDIHATGPEECKFCTVASQDVYYTSRYGTMIAMPAAQKTRRSSTMSFLTSCGRMYVVFVPIFSSLTCLCKTSAAVLLLFQQHILTPFDSYSESHALLSKQPTFYTNNPRVLIGFASTCPPSYFHTITSLELSTTVPALFRRTNHVSTWFSNLPSSTLLTRPRVNSASIAYNALLVVLLSMRNLQGLKLTILMDSPHKDAFALSGGVLLRVSEWEVKILAPLMSIDWLKRDRFEVEVDWPIVGRERLHGIRQKKKDVWDDAPFRVTRVEWRGYKPWFLSLVTT